MEYLSCDKNRTAIPVTNMEQNIGNEPMGAEESQGLDTRFNIRVISHRKRKHDPDGVSIKAVLDGLVQRGILQDDSTEEIGKITFESIKSNEEKTIIEITPIRAVPIP